MTPRRPRVDRLVAWSPVLLLGGLAALTYWLDAQVQSSGTARRRIVAARPRSFHRAIQRGHLRRRRPGAADARGDPRRALSGRRQRRSHRAGARARPIRASPGSRSPPSKGTVSGRSRNGHAARPRPRHARRCARHRARQDSARRGDVHHRDAAGSFRRRRGPRPTPS